MPDGIKWHHIVEGWLILGGLTYGAGWLFFALLYAEFDVTPEQAGITFQFITTRVSFFLVVATALLLFVIAGFPRRMSEFLQSGEWNVARRLFLLVFSTVQVIIVAVLILGVSAWRPWRAFESPWNLAVATALVVGCAFVVFVEIGVVLSEVNFTAFKKIYVVRPRVAAFLSVVVVGAFVLGPLLVGAPKIADSVRDGHDFTWFGVRINTVRVAWTDPSVAQRLGLTGSERCAVLLGANDGTLVLYFRATERTVVTAAENVSVALILDRGCTPRKKP